MKEPGAAPPDATPPDAPPPPGTVTEKEAEQPPEAPEECEEVLAGSGRDFDLVAAGDRADRTARDQEEASRGFLYQQTARARRRAEELRSRLSQRLDEWEERLERRRKVRLRQTVEAELRRVAVAAEILDPPPGLSETMLGPSQETVARCEVLCFEDEEVLSAFVQVKQSYSSTLAQVLQGRPWRDVLPRCLCQLTIAVLLALAVFCIAAAVAFAPTRSIAFDASGIVQSPQGGAASAASAVVLRPLWAFPGLSLQLLRQVENVVFEEGGLRHALSVAVTEKRPDGSVTLRSTETSLRVEQDGRGFWLRPEGEVFLADMESLRQLPGADTSLAWLGGMFATEVLQPS